MQIESLIVNDNRRGLVKVKVKVEVKVKWWWWW